MTPPHTVGHTIASPLGPLRLVTSDAGLTGLWFAQHHPPPTHWGNDGHHPILLQAEAELGAWFQGTRKMFSIPIAPTGTAFQRDIWRVLQQIPFGQVWTYTDVARAILRPDAVRAVGTAIARNPLCIIIPCHRVVGQGGRLTGYAGGLPNKQWLLDHERQQGSLFPVPRQQFS